MNEHVNCRHGEYIIYEKNDDFEKRKDASSPSYFIIPKRPLCVKEETIFSENLLIQRNGRQSYGRSCNENSFKWRDFIISRSSWAIGIGKNKDETGEGREHQENLQ